MTEFDFVEHIILELERGNTLKKDAQSSQRFKILREVSLGYGIADIVVAKYKASSIERQSVLELPAVKIYNIINLNPGITVDELLDGTRASKRSICKAIDVLANEGLIAVKENGIFKTNKYAKIKIVRSAMAIEAKLKDWRRALKQAYRYKWFAERSFVCLPKIHIKSALINIDEFKRYEVGLIQHSLEQGLEVMYKPRSIKPICQEMRFLLNECLVKQLMCSSEN